MESKVEQRFRRPPDTRRIHGDAHIELLLEINDGLRSINHRLAEVGAHKIERQSEATTSSHLLASQVALPSGEQMLFQEGELDRLSRQTPVDLSLFDSPTDPHTVEYAKTHALRLRQTFSRLEELSERDNSDVVEIGAASFYSKSLESLFPKSKTTYVGKPLHNVASNATGNFIEFDLEQRPWPFDDSSVDFFLCFEVLEHIFDDPMNVFAEVNRCLRVGGKFILTTPNIASWRSLRAIITHYSPYLYVPFFPGIPRWESHRVEYSIRDIMEFGRAGGFSTTIDTFNSYTLVPESSLLKRVFAELGFNTELRGDTIYAVLEKVGPVVSRFPEWFYKGYEESYIKTGLIKI
jgi:SAM-dependent methyltransferase